MTQMSDAFARAGLSRIDYEAATAALRFINSGGSREAWMQAFDRAAASKRSGDRSRSASDGLVSSVPASPPMPSGGHTSSGDYAYQPPANARLPITSGHMSTVQRDHYTDAAGDPIPAVGHVDIAQRGQRVDADGGKPILGGGQSEHVGGDQKSPASTQNPITSGAAKRSLPNKVSNAMPPAREPTRSYINAMAESRRATAKVQLELIKTSNGVVWGSIRPREFVGMIRDGHMAWAITEAFGPFSSKQENMQLREFMPDAVFKKAITLAEVNHVG